MKNHVWYLDGVAISLSLICLVHCLLLPFIILTLPNLVLLELQNEAFHQWMLFLVVPFSLFALLMGCRTHKQKQFFIFSLVGISVIFLSAFFVEEHFGERRGVYTRSG